MSIYSQQLPSTKMWQEAVGSWMTTPPALKGLLAAGRELCPVPLSRIHQGGQGDILCSDSHVDIPFTSLSVFQSSEAYLLYLECI